MSIEIPQRSETVGANNANQSSVVADFEVAVPGQPIMVSDGAWFLQATYMRTGPDLQLTGPDGQELTVRGYFNQSPPPDLTTNDGVVLSGHVTSQLAGPRAPAQFAQTVPTSVSEPIGRVETSTGPVNATRADGTQVTLTQGDPVYAGDILETGTDGAVGIVFADESTFSLAESGRMTLDEMIYDPGAQEGTMSINLLQGAFTFVSGQIAKTDVDAMKIATPTATIGIRGTAGGGHIDADGVTTAVLLPEIGFIGELSITNGAGTQTINQAGQAINVASFNALPSLPFSLTPQQIGQSFGAALNALPNANAAIENSIIQGSELGLQQQHDARQAVADAQINQALAQGAAQEAADAEAAAQADADAAQAAEAEVAAQAAAAASAAAEAEAAAAQAANAAAALAAEATAAEAAAAEAIAAAQAPTATDAELAAAQAATNVVEQARAAAEQAAQQAQQAAVVQAQAQIQAVQEQAQAQAVAARTAEAQAIAAQAAAVAAEAQAQFASATAEAAQAQLFVVQTSATGAVVSAARNFGINVPGTAELNDVQAAAQAAQQQAQQIAQQAQQAQAQALQAATVAQQAQAVAAEAQAQAQAETQSQALQNGGGPQPGDAPGNGDLIENAAQQAATDAIAGGANAEQVLAAAVNAATQQALAEGQSQAEIDASVAIADAAYRDALANGATPEQALAAALNAAAANGNGDINAPDVGDGTGQTGVPVGGTQPGDRPDLAANLVSQDGTTTSDTTRDDGLTFDYAAIFSAETDIRFEGLTTDSRFETFSGLDEDSRFNTDDRTENVINISREDTTVIREFDEVLSATTGNDNLIGSDVNTQITMRQGSTLGGTDTINGGGGTDELTLSNLSAFKGVFNVSSNSMSYSSSVNSISGSISLTSIEQLYADDGATSRVRFNIEGGTSGYGYMIAGVDGTAGGAGDDTINISNGQSISELDHSISDSTTIGSILFGGSGNDTITGSGSEDEIFGGADDDTLTGGAGNDKIYGGAGNDTINAQGTDSISGGAGTDTLILSNLGDTVAVNTVETITGGTGNDTVTLGAAQSSGTIDLGAGTDKLVLANGTNVLSLANVETVTGGAGSDSLTLTSLAASGTTIVGGSGTDTLTLSNTGNNVLTVGNFTSVTGNSGNDAITLGGTTTGTITGGAGADTITLSGTTTAQKVSYNAATDGASAGSNSGYDHIYGFTSGSDKVILASTLGSAIETSSSGTLNTVTDTAVNFATTEGLVLSATQGLTDTSIFDSSHASVVSALNALGITAASGDDGIIIVQSSSTAPDTAIFVYTENGTTTNNVEASELSLLAQVHDATVAATDFSTPSA